MSNKPNITTLGQLKASGYISLSLKQELRKNLIQKLRDKKEVFTGIQGFENSVIPQLERAILSGHHVLFLGLRGQAKTRLARLLVNLLDDFVPIIAGSALNEDPFIPLTNNSKKLVDEMGDATPIDWIPRDDRYVEKLATPDVSVSDLIGDVDPILAASLKLPYSDERTIHYGLVPRANRSIFVINELPDLQPRIQVALFNILQEGDIQIRGFRLRMPLDIQFVFTANPEDYTNRGTIVTPLKDRIQSQILTHYPPDIITARDITKQEIRLQPEQKQSIFMPEVLEYLLETVVVEARESEMVDEKSGVSARLGISAYESLVSGAERRMIINGENKATVRLSDIYSMIPAMTGKMELVYEGEQKGPEEVSREVIGEAIKKTFLLYFPNPEKLKKKTDKDPFIVVKSYFQKGKTVQLDLDATEEDYKLQLSSVDGLLDLVLDQKEIPDKDNLFWQELILHGLAEFQAIQREVTDQGTNFKDEFNNLLRDLDLN
jgi:magnesium chelatase subunit I